MTSVENPIPDQIDTSLAPPVEHPGEWLLSWMIPVAGSIITLVFLYLPTNSVFPGSPPLTFVDEWIKEAALLILGPILLMTVLLVWLGDRNSARSLPSPWVTWPYLLYLTGVVISSSLAKMPWVALQELLQVYLLPSAAFFWPVVLLRWSDKEIKRLALVMLIAGSILATIGISQYLEWKGWFTMFPHHGPGSLLYNKNLAGEYLILILPFGVAMTWLHVGVRRILFGLTSLLLLEYLLATMARGAWVGLLGGSLLVATACWWLTRRHPSKEPGPDIDPKLQVLARRRWMKGIMAVTVAMSMAIWALPKAPKCEECSVWHHFSSIIVTGSPERLDFWQDTLNMLPEHGWLGVGAGHFRFTFPTYMKRSMAHVRWNDASGDFGYPDRPHNDYLQIWIETGVTGVVGLVLLFGIILVNGLRSWRQARLLEERERSVWLLASMVAMIGFMITMMFEFPFEMPATAIHGWMAAGLVVALSQWNQARHWQPQWRHLWMGMTLVGGSGLVFLGAIFAFCLIMMDIQFGKGLVAANRNDVNKALNWVDDSLNFSPMSDRPQLLKVRMELMTGQYARVLADAARILPNQPYLGPIKWYQARALVALKRYPEAKVALYEVRTKYPYITEAIELTKQIQSK